MKLALLGDDPELAALAIYAVETEGQQLVLAHAGTAEVSQRFPRAVREGWEELLTGRVADVVLVGGSGEQERIAEQLRLLVQSGVAVVTAHPPSASMLLCYELAMIQEDSHSLLLPYFPSRWHPAVERLMAVAADRDLLGNVEQVVAERQTHERSRAQVERQFARDVELARALVGGLERIAALAPTGDEPYANLGVQLSGGCETIVRWSVGPVSQSSGTHWTVTGTRGSARLWLPDTLIDVRLEVTSAADSSDQHFATFDAARTGWARIERALAGEPYAPSWNDACRAVELAETIERSLIKGRTVDLHFEDYSEQSTFKGTMTSLGCGLLLLGLMVVVVASVAEGLGMPLFRFWPHVLLGVLAVFLALQGLRLVFLPQRE